jgi:uncharacterized RDD family membrane protein YckC
MSSTEPPVGGTPGDATPPPPPPPSADYGSTPPPPPPGSYGQQQYGYGAPGAPVAGVPRPGELLDRFLARLLDGLIVGIPTGIIGAILTIASDSWFMANLITSVLYAAAFLGYFGFMESSRGTTIGKQVLKLKVVGPDGHSNPTMEQAIRRNIWNGFYIFNVIPFIGWLARIVLGVISIVLLVTGINKAPERRTWFDTFAGGCQVLKVG